MYELVWGACARGFAATKRITKLKFLAITVLLIGALLPSLVAMPAFASPGLTVSNALILDNVKPGQTFTQMMTVAIGSADPATDVSVAVFGVAQSLQGGYELLDAAHDTSLYSARTFVTVDKSSFHLDPGGSENVTATVKVPQDVGDGGRYAIINFKTQPVAGAGVSIITAVDVPVYLTISGSKIIQTGKITGVTAGKVTSGQPINILTDFQNTGNHHFKVQGQVTVKGPDGETIGTVSMPLTSSSILPGMTRELQATFNPTSAPSPGTYTIDAGVTSEDGTNLDESTATFQVSQPYAAPSATNPEATTSNPGGVSSASTAPAPLGSNAASGSGMNLTIIVAVVAGIIIIVLVVLLLTRRK